MQRSCSDLRSAEPLTASTNVGCDRELVIPRRQTAASAAACWSLRCCSSTATPAAVVEILRSSRSPSDAGRPWTDSLVRRTKDPAASATASRRTGSFPVDVELAACQRTDGRQRTGRRRRSAASSSLTSHDADADSRSSAPRRHAALTSQDYDDDVTDDRMTSEVTSSSPPSADTTAE